MKRKNSRRNPSSLKQNANNYISRVISNGFLTQPGLIDPVDVSKSRGQTTVMHQSHATTTPSLAGIEGCA